MKSIRNRSFVLMEVMLAFALICFSILPFLHYPMRYMKKDLGILLEMEAIHQIEQRVTNLQIDLFQNKIDPSRLFVKTLQRHTPTRLPLNVELGPWERTYYIEELIRRTELKKDKAGIETAKVLITVRLYKHKKDKVDDLLFETNRIAVAQKAP